MFYAGFFSRFSFTNLSRKRYAGSGTKAGQVPLLPAFCFCALIRWSVDSNCAIPHEEPGSYHCYG